MTTATNTGPGTGPNDINGRTPMQPSTVYGAPPAITKRRVDDAMYSLDEAFRATSDRSLSRKRKIGDSDEVSTPRLVALLKKKRLKRLPFFESRQGSPAPTSYQRVARLSEYCPSSVPQLLSRLATYKLHTYSVPKPRKIHSVAAARHGWINTGGKERLECPVCSNAFRIEVVKEGWTSHAGRRLSDVYAEKLVTEHALVCPWRTRCCSPFLYRVPLLGRKNVLDDLLARSQPIDGVGLNKKAFRFRHPLTPDDVTRLRDAIQRDLRLRKIRATEASTPSSTSPANGSGSSHVQYPGVLSTLASFLRPGVSNGSTAPVLPVPPIPDPFVDYSPSDVALILALFGWTVEQKPHPSSAPSSRHGSRASSIAPSTISGTPRPATPVADLRAQRTNSAVSHPPPDPQLRAVPGSKHPPPGHGDILTCQLCQRRVGTWSFLPSPSSSQPDPFASSFAIDPKDTKAFDVLSEHMTYCPFIDPLAGTDPLLSSDDHSEAVVQSQLLPGWKLVFATLVKAPTPTGIPLPDDNGNDGLEEPAREGGEAERDDGSSGGKPKHRRRPSLAENKKKNQEVLGYVRTVLGPTEPVQRRRRAAV